MLYRLGRMRYNPYMDRADRQFCVLILAAATLRLALLFTSQGGAIADETVTGLMAMHILQGRSLPFYVYGASYNGGAAITAYLAAPLFWLGGISSFTLKLVPLFFSLAYLFVTYTFVKRFFGPRAAVIAGILLLLDPGYLKWNLDARGGQIINLLLTVTLSYIFYRIYFEKASKPGWYFSFGLVVGLGYWNFTYLLVLACGLFLLLVLGEHKTFLVRRLPLVAIGSLVGATAVILHAVFPPGTPEAHWPFLRLVELGEIPFNFLQVLTIRLPGLFSPWNDMHVVLFYSWILFSVTLACVVFLAVADRSGGLAAARALMSFGHSAPQRDDPAARVWPMLAYLPLYLALASVVHGGAGQTRYLLPVYPFLTILTAISIARLLEGTKLRRALGQMSIVAFALIGLGVHATFLGQESATNEDKLVTRDGRLVVLAVRDADLRSLIEFLESEKIRCVYAPAELRSKIIFESQERILASNRYLTVQHDYYPAYAVEMEGLIARGEPYAFVFRDDMLFCVGAWHDADVPMRWARTLASLAHRGRGFQTRRIGALVVYWRFTADVRTEIARAWRWPRYAE